jgi:hypothetical protein
LQFFTKKDVKKIIAVFFPLNFLVIKILDPDPDSLEMLDMDPDSLEMLDMDPYPDPDSMKADPRH